MTTAVKLVCALTPILATLFFLYVSKSWSMLFFIIALITLIALISAHLLPESPKYLVSKGRFAEAREVIHFIAWINKAPQTNFRFDTEKDLVLRDRLPTKRASMF